MLRFLAGLFCRFTGHLPSHQAERDDARNVYVNRCARHGCGAQLYVTLPCAEYPDEGMHNCGDVMCSRVPSADDPDVCEDAVTCRAAWDAAQKRGASPRPTTDKEPTNG